MTYSSHGTRCAGEVSAARDNDVCGVGVAYDSKVAGKNFVSLLFYYFTKIPIVCFKVLSSQNLFTPQNPHSLFQYWKWTSMWQSWIFSCEKKKKKKRTSPIRQTYFSCVVTRELWESVRGSIEGTARNVTSKGIEKSQKRVNQNHHHFGIN